jgi:hypothetical protein
MKNKKIVISVTDFWLGIIVGFIATAIIFSFVLWIVISKYNNKEILNYAEKQIEIEKLREDGFLQNHSNRPYDDFLEIPDVRRAADRAAAEFERKRDEALQRFRSRLSSRARRAN